MDKWFEPVPFATRVCLSALGGCLAGWLYFASHDFDHLEFEAIYILKLIQATLFFVIITFIMTLPLTAVALLIGLMLRKQIVKRPATWTIVATFMTWITAISALVLFGGKNQWWMTHSYSERLRYVITSGDNMLCLAGAVGAGATLYMLGLIRLGQERVE